MIAIASAPGGPGLAPDLLDQRRAIDQREHAILGQLSAAEERHVADDVLARIGLPCCLHQMVAADPDQPVGVRRRAAHLIGLLQQNRLQAVLNSGERG